MSIMITSDSAMSEQEKKELARIWAILDGEDKFKRFVNEFRSCART